MVPNDIMELLEELYEEESDYDPDTEISDALLELFNWAHTGKALEVLPVAAVDVVRDYYREAAYEEWEDMGRPEEFPFMLIALEYFASITDRYADDKYQLNNYYLLSPQPDFAPQSTVREYLTLRVAQLGLAESYEAEVLQAGSQYTEYSPIVIGPYPHSYCFFNAAYVARTLGHTYVEGFAKTKTALWPVHHAWNVDDEGRIIDTTWPEGGVDYFGIANPTRSIARYH